MHTAEGGSRRQQHYSFALTSSAAKSEPAALARAILAIGARMAPIDGLVVLQLPGGPGGPGGPGQPRRVRAVLVWKKGTGANAQQRACIHARMAWAPGFWASRAEHLGGCIFKTVVPQNALSPDDGRCIAM